MTRFRKAAYIGVSLVEILIALAIFSTAIVGLYMAMNGMSQAIATTMKRDIEAAYAGMVLNSINPADRLVETKFDAKTPPGTPNCAGVRCSVTLPTGDKFYYTLEVQSTATAADVKLIDMYLYHSATATTPYRQFHRQYILTRWGCIPRNLPGTFYVDSLGQKYEEFCDMAAGPWSSTAGAYSSGRDTTISTGGMGYNLSGLGNPANVADPFMFTGAEIASGTTPAGDMGWIYPASANHNYTVTLGFNEFYAAVTGSGQRIFDVYLNNVKVDTIDIWAQSGGQNKPLVRFYSTTPITVSGVSVIRLELRQNGGTQPPIISYLDIARS